ncbi:MAG: heavy metal sensor histidine kinase [Pseudobdellovibrionaceae bacterium]
MIFRSLSVRLTLYSFALTYLLLIGSWGLIYFAVDRALFFRSQEIISDRLKTIQNLLQLKQTEPERLIRRVEKEWPNRSFERIFVRVMDENERLVTETPGLNSDYEDILKIFPTVADNLEEHIKLKRIDLREHVFNVGSFIVSAPDSKVDYKYFVQIAWERTNEESLLSTLRKSLIYILAFGFVGSLLIGRVTVRKVLKSIQEISETARKVSTSGLKERIDPLLLPIEFKEIADALNEMLNRLDSSFERLRRFSEDMAHELRTPLNNLLGSLEVGLSKERSCHEYHHLLGSSIEECGRLKRIIDSLLFIARSHQPKQEIQKQNLHLKSEIESILSFYEASADKKNILLRLESSQDLYLLAERVLLQRAIGNLLSNAIRHSSEKSEIVVSAALRDSFIEISVRDQGEGIPTDLLPKIGDRFFRVEASRSQSSGGHGLGLSIVRSIVEIHGGQMKLQSILGQGSTFCLLFPA